jgi:uncharacterized membrane protein YgcG
VSFIHPAWTAIINGASWIWGDDPVADPAATTTYTFTRTFEWNGPVTGATLDIASDNTYSVVLNGTEVGSSTDDNNFAAGTQDSFDVSGQVVQGVNTLKMTVTNFALEGATDPEENPAGLLYRLSSVGSDPSCDEVPDDQDVSSSGDDDEDDDNDGRSGSSRRSSGGGGGGGGSGDDDDDGEVLGASTSIGPDDGSILGSFFPGFPNTGEGGVARTLSMFLLIGMALGLSVVSFRAFRRT